MGQSYSMKRRQRNKLINRDNLSRYRRQNGMPKEIWSLKMEATVHSILTSSVPAYNSNRVEIRVYRGPTILDENFESYAPWGYYVKQPAEGDYL